MKLILGSGIVGLLAKLVLGDDWQLIPFGRSRFFSFNPPLDDNFIIADERIAPVISSLGLATTPMLIKRCYSYQGQLSADPLLVEPWLYKLFGDSPPPHALPYMKQRTVLSIYPDARVNQIYQKLQQRYEQEIRKQLQLGNPTALGDHWIQFGKQRLEFERVVSTVPLKLLLQLAGRPDQPKLAPVHFVHLRSSSIDLEQASQAFVVDRQLSFYKVSCLAPQRYLFYFHQEVPNLGEYLMRIMADYDLLDGTRVDDYLPCGPAPDLSWAEQWGVHSVGAYAQHDWCADVGTNLLRLLLLSGRDFRPKSQGLINV